MANSTFGIKTRCSVTTSRRVRTAKSMTDRFRLSSTWAQRFADHQIAVTALLRHAGLPTGLFQQEKVHVTTAELFALWRSVSEMSSDPAIELKLGTEPRFERNHPSAIAVICSRSFGDALERIGSVAGGYDPGRPRRDVPWTGLASLSRQLRFSDLRSDFF